MRGRMQDLWRLGRRWWDRLAASDPGSIRLQLALRTTTAVALALAVLHSLALAAHLPGTIIVLGLVESLFGSIGVRDPQAQQQRVTLLLTPFPAAAAFALGTVLAPFKTWSDVTFLVVIFAAVYVRRFGLRATALGFLGFIPYFMGSYLHLPVAQLPYQMMSLAIGTGCTYLTRFYIVAARPEQMLVRALRSFDRRIDQLLAEVAADVLGQRHHRRLRRQISRLNDTLLIAEDQFDLVDTGGFLSAADRRKLRLRAFDVELAADRLAEAALRDLPSAAVRPEMRQELRARIAGLRRRFHDPLPSLLRAPETGAQQEFARALQSAERPSETAGQRFIRALSALEAAIRASPEPETEAAFPPEPEESAARAPDKNAAGESNQQDGKLRPTTMQAIQVTTACALAIIAGEFLSPQRWYWAVITAFVVFSGTQSRGDTMIKAGQRMIGTVLGVAAGIAVADTVHDIGLSLLLIYICIFLAYYLFQIAYGAMMFWVSIIVALLYRMIGIFTPSLLLLRIEETAIGAVIGIAVALLVLPTSTTVKTADALREFLQHLGDTVEGAARHMTGERNAFDIAGTSRDLDRALQALRTTARPLASGLAGAVAGIAVRRFLSVLRACSYYARDLARLSAQRDSGEDSELARRLVETALRIRHDSEALADLIAHQRLPIAAAAGVLERVEEAVAARFDDDPRWHAAPDRQIAALYDIEHIEAAIRLLEQDLAARGRGQGKAKTDASASVP